jgi:hypothetical protein
MLGKQQELNQNLLLFKHGMGQVSVERVCVLQPPAPSPPTGLPLPHFADPCLNTPPKRANLGRMTP